MPHQIRVSDEVYQMLLALQRPRESFSELIGRLLTAAVLLSKIEPLLQGQHEFLKRQVEKHEQEKAAER